MKSRATIRWEKASEDVFTDQKYSRKHQWQFDGGISVWASASPQIVSLPMSDASAIDPEEAFVALLSSCHMLFFLSIAASNGYIVNSYEDFAEGILEEGDNGGLVMTTVNLYPQVIFSEKHEPAAEDLVGLHQKAHEKC